MYISVVPSVYTSYKKPNSIKKVFPYPLTEYLTKYRNKCLYNQIVFCTTAWRMVFKVAQGTTHGSYSSLYAFYTASGSYNEGDISAMTNFAASSKLYKSSILDDWGTTRLITAVSITGFHISHIYGPGCTNIRGF